MACSLHEKVVRQDAPVSRTVYLDKACCVKNRLHISPSLRLFFNPPPLPALASPFTLSTFFPIGHKRWEPRAYSGVTEIIGLLRIASVETQRSHLHHCRRIHFASVTISLAATGDLVCASRPFSLHSSSFSAYYALCIRSMRLSGSDRHSPKSRSRLTIYFSYI